MRKEKNRERESRAFKREEEMEREREPSYAVRKEKIQTQMETNPAPFYPMLLFGNKNKTRTNEPI